MFICVCMAQYGQDGSSAVLGRAGGRQAQSRRKPKKEEAGSFRSSFWRARRFVGQAAPLFLWLDFAEVNVAAIRIKQDAKYHKPPIFDGRRAGGECDNAIGRSHLCA